MVYRAPLPDGNRLERPAGAHRRLPLVCAARQGPVLRVECRWPKVYASPRNARTVRGWLIAAAGFASALAGAGALARAACTARLLKSWGPHLIDVNIAMGDLIDFVATLRSRAPNPSSITAPCPSTFTGRARRCLEQLRLRILLIGASGLLWARDLQRSFRRATTSHVHFDESGDIRIDIANPASEWVRGPETSGAAGRVACAAGAVNWRSAVSDQSSRAWRNPGTESG